MMSSEIRCKGKPTQDGYMVPTIHFQCPIFASCGTHKYLHYVTMTFNLSIIIAPRYVFLLKISWIQLVIG
jgi:hypothetical protein